MKSFKLKVTGSFDNFNIEYDYSTNFVQYNPCSYQGNEQEKYTEFYEDLEKNGGPQPLNIKVKMTNQTVGRALPKNEVLKFKDAKSFVERLAR
ncbi:MULTISPECIES: hypothetical protein [Clostridium]|uniref:hypothetical protein n=1 Tax=Clostridium TaxID=1485 RepID=UPI00069E9763|nr:MULTISPECIES: hypothetical protein [Clostridium]KOF56835.1 hypothetical protein AGR56_09300 [Clostridium sp. DMHC 10]MCD2347783.1 hypothetical protein [Clostridium guangxiense]